jgi:hypothetical protein
MTVRGMRGLVYHFGICTQICMCVLCYRKTILSDDFQLISNLGDLSNVICLRR